MADVFVSYAREDRPFAARLAHALEAGGRTVWWDREILPGKDFAELIAAELAQAKAVVVIWSPASGKSGWVRDEAHEGLERGILVPVLVGVAEPPIGYRSIHAVDLTGWEGGEHPGLVDLGLAVDSLRTGVPVPDRPEIATTEARPRPKWPRRAIVGILAICALGAAVLVLPSLIEWRDNPDRPQVPTSGGAGAAKPFRDCPECPEMVPVPAGRFTMGASWFDRESQSDERPRVDVVVDAPVRDRAHGGHLRAVAGLRRRRRLRRPAAGRCGLGPRQPAGGRRRLERGAGLCRVAAAADRQALPAAERGRVGICLPCGHRRPPIPFGEAIGPALANYGRNHAGTREVASYPPNPWGLYDLNGNVWEWVEDVWNDGHSGRPADAAARLTGPDPQEHVIKGGSWDDRDRRARCASRNGVDDTHRENEIGFRVALPQ